MEDGIEGVEDILIVEDNPAEIRFIEEAFSSSQFDVTIHSATTSDEALDYVQQQGEHVKAPTPDVILLDWHLTQTTGEEVLQAAKSVDPAISVVVMTGSTPEASSVKSAFPQANRYIEKQTDPEAYIEILRSSVTDQ